MIGERIGEVVARMRTVIDGPPYYMYGRRGELTERLVKKDQSVTNKDKKYPLILLFTDVNSPRVGDVYKHNLQIAIITYSSIKKNRNTEQRSTQVIEPILEPLYERFISKLAGAGLFMWEGDLSSPPHTRIDHANYGVPTEEINVRQYFVDTVDAIELEDLAINEVVCDEDEDEEINNAVIITRNDIIVIPT